MNKLLDGTVEQSSFTWDHADYMDTRINFPVIGIVMSLYPSDHPRNRSSAEKDDQRGHRWEADVYVVNDGSDTSFIVPNAVITPPGASGVDNFHEELPKASSQMVDGSKFGVAEVDEEKLDGDWCVVQFIGGDITQPIITNWFPHPSNYKDSATSGQASPTTLSQGRRLLKRYYGAKMTITNKGSIFIDTNESNSTVSGTEGGLERENVDEGGDIQIDVKSTRRLEVNFNEPVADPLGEPSLPQENPPAISAAISERSILSSKFYMDKDFINAVAGQVVELVAQLSGASIKLTEFGNVEADGPGFIVLGNVPIPLGLTNGLVHASGVDPFTGKTYGILGNASNKVIGEK